MGEHRNSDVNSSDVSCKCWKFIYNGAKTINMLFLISDSRPESVTLKPDFVISKPSIKKSTSCFIGTGSTFTWLAAIAGNVAIVEIWQKNKVVVKYHLVSQQQPPTSDCTVALPRGLSSHCRKYILDNGYIMLRDRMDTIGSTHVFSSALQPLKTYTGNYGELIGTLSPNLLAYNQQSSASQGNEYIQIYSCKTRVACLH